MMCYVLLLHTKFAQAERLVRRIAGHDVLFAIHIDAKVKTQDFENFKSAISDLPGVFYAKRIDGRWGSFGQAEAIMSGVQCAASISVAFERCILLSGQDYPIAKRSEIEKFFLANASTEYCEAQSIDITDETADGWSPYYRFRRHHVWIAGRRCAIPFLRKSLPAEVIYHGSTWWALTRSAILYIAKEFERNRKLRAFLRTGFLVDEVYIPTLLMNSNFSGAVARVNVTFAEWAPGTGPHPKMLDVDDVPKLLASRKLFARKFDDQNGTTVLDLLDATIEDC